MDDGQREASVQVENQDPQIPPVQRRSLRPKKAANYRLGRNSPGHSDELSEDYSDPDDEDVTAEKLLHFHGAVSADSESEGEEEFFYSHPKKKRKLVQPAVIAGEVAESGDEREESPELISNGRAEVTGASFDLDNGLPLPEDGPSQSQPVNGIFVQPPTEMKKSLPAEQFKCRFAFCGCVFTSIHRLLRHERKHPSISDNGKKRYACVFLDCGKRFAEGHQLLRHRMCHTGEKQFACWYVGCKYRAAERKAVSRHFLVHTGEKPFKCTFPDCDAAFRQNIGLRLHLVRKHDEGDPARNGSRSLAYACTRPGCKYQCMAPKDLKRHELAHSGLRQFACQVEGCGRAFTLLQHLTRHSKSHSDVKPITCSVEGCTFRTAHPHALKQHCRVRHPSADTVVLKKVKCDYDGCDYETVYGGNMEVHKYRHTGEKPFRCPVKGCKYKAGNHGTIHWHMKSSHPGVTGRAIKKKRPNFKDRRMLFLKDSVPLDSAFIPASEQPSTLTDFFSEYTIGVTQSGCSTFLGVDGKEQPNFFIEFDGYDKPAISLPNELLPAFIGNIFDTSGD